MPTHQQPSKALARQDCDTLKQLQQVHLQGMQKKELFKAYLQRHGVLEAVNDAMQQLFASTELPEDPLKYLGDKLLQASIASNGECETNTIQKEV